MTATVQLTSPFPFESLPRIWRWVEPYRDKISDDFSPQTLEAFMDQAREQWDHQTTWAIHADGELAGLIVFEKLNDWLGTAHWILKPELHGRGIAYQASRRAVKEMFDTGIGKLAVYPLGGNYAMGSLLKRLGAVREGTLVAHTLCHGQPTDLWIYGLTKSEFDKQGTPCLLVSQPS